MKKVVSGIHKAVSTVADVRNCSADCSCRRAIETIQRRLLVLEFASLAQLAEHLEVREMVRSAADQLPTYDEAVGGQSALPEPPLPNYEQMLSDYQQRRPNSPGLMELLTPTERRDRTLRTLREGELN